jgi:hypothetical protein
MKTARLCLGLLGLAAVGYGLAGLFTDPGTRPLNHLLFLGGILVGHDLALLPLAILLGTLLTRWMPGWARAPVQVGLLASAVVSFVALPFVIGAGRRPDDPSALPLNYTRGLTLVLALVWLVVALAAVRRRASSRPDNAPP